MSSPTRLSGSYPFSLYIRVLARFAPLRAGVTELSITSRLRDAYTTLRTAGVSAILSKDYWLRFNRWRDWKTQTVSAQQ